MKKLFLAVAIAGSLAVAAKSALPTVLDEAHWRHASAADEMGVYQAYVSSRPGGRHAAEAKTRIDLLKWRQAVQRNSVVAYQAYLADSPDSRHAARAAHAIETLRGDDGPFLAARAQGTPRAFETFLVDFPGHRREADVREALRDLKEGHDVADLIAAQKVEATALGSGIRSIELQLRRRVDHPITVRIPVGTFLVSRNAAAQNMVTTIEEQVTLTTPAWRTVTVQAACANRPRDIPGRDDHFDVRRSPRQKELQRLMPVLRAAGADYAIQQAAVWIVTDDADFGDLGTLVRRSAFQLFGGERLIKEFETATAMKICRDAGIDITRKAIWRDRDVILQGLQDESLKAWLRGAGP